MGMSNLGRTIVQTAGVDAMRSESKEFDAFVQAAMHRFVECNWGDTAEDSVERNNAVVCKGVQDQLFAVYKMPETLVLDDYRDRAVWIITEYDKSVTTILFPSEY